MARATRTRTAAATASKTASTMGPVLGIVAALQDELTPTVMRLGLEKQGQVYLGEYAGHRVVATVSGMGAAKAADGFNRLVTRYGAKEVYSIGFAGGLQLNATPGSVGVFQAVIDPVTQAMIRLDKGAPEKLDALIPSLSPVLVTVDHLVHTLAEKVILAERWGALAVDMESFGVAKAALARGVPVKLIRAISDPVGMSVPEEVATFVNQDGSRNLMGVAMYVLKHPGELKVIMQLGKNAKAAAENLATMVEHSIKRGDAAKAAAAAPAKPPADAGDAKGGAKPGA